MSEFEKALNEKANERVKMLTEALRKYHGPSLEPFDQAVDNSFQSGAHWAREFTVREICEWVIGDGEFIVRNHCPANLKRAIESHFKDRGGEK